MVRRGLVAGVLTAAIAVLPAAPPAPAGAVGAAGPASAVVVSVALDSPRGQGSSGPVEFTRAVVPGPGVELDHADRSANPSGWVGSLAVDVDPVAHTITVTSDEGGDFQTADVHLAGLGATGVTLVSDSLWVNPSTDVPTSPVPVLGPVMAPASVAVAAGDVDLTWGTSPADTTATIELNPHGAAVFRYTVPAPPTTVPGATTTVAGGSTTAPSTGSTLPLAPVAQPVTAQPTYTG